MCSAPAHVRFAPESGLLQCNSLCPLWARSGHRRSLDQLVGEPEQLRWHCNTECFGCFEVDNKGKLTWLFDRQISRFGAFEDLVDIDRGTFVDVLIARSIRHQPPDLYNLFIRIHVW